MHDMGFMPQIHRIMSRMPEDRQTMMFTATMDGEVERLARSNMRDPVRIQIGIRCAPAHGAKQQLFELSEEGKTPKLLELLRNSGEGRVLVFVRTKRGVDRLARIVRARGFDAAVIHGDREQAQRDAAMAGFRDGKYRILIATDIAARGIDVADIEHVINYDFPRHSEDYVHRIGRTARQDAVGLASSFITRADRAYVAQVRKLIGDKLPKQIGSADGSDDFASSSHEGTYKGERRSGRRRTGGRPAGGHGGHHATGHAKEHSHVHAGHAVAGASHAATGAIHAAAGTAHATAQSGTEGDCAKPKRRRRRRRGGQDASQKPQMA
jgi:ATP-dependent RNA helicase RhlE